MNDNEEEDPVDTPASRSCDLDYTHDVSDPSGGENDNTADDFGGVEHEEINVPDFVAGKYKTEILSKLPLWRSVNTSVVSRSPFRPVKLFKHCTQSFYSKCKGGVDGATQARSLLRSQSAHLKWEQKITSQVLKTVIVNSFIIWRMAQREDALESRESFKDLDKYRHLLNNVESLGSFVLSFAEEILTMADIYESGVKCGGHNMKLNDPDDTGIEQELLPDDPCAKLLHEKALKRRGKRLHFFNTSEGTKLRLGVAGHNQRFKRDTPKYCALCSASGNIDKRHRSSYYCVMCNVHLCVRLHSWKRKSCWAIFHETKRLQVPSGATSLETPQRTQRNEACRETDTPQSGLEERRKRMQPSSDCDTLQSPGEASHEERRGYQRNKRVARESINAPEREREKENTVQEHLQPNAEHSLRIINSSRTRHPRSRVLLKTSRDHVESVNSSGIRHTAANSRRPLRRSAPTATTPTRKNISNPVLAEDTIAGNDVGALVSCASGCGNMPKLKSVGSAHSCTICKKPVHAWCVYAPGGEKGGEEYEGHGGGGYCMQCSKM